MPPKKDSVKTMASNRKAFHEYFIIERYEAGISLAGTEVKSIRQGTLNLQDSFCTIKGTDLIVHGMHISPYEKGNVFNRDPDRDRRLLMHKREIIQISSKIQRDGYTLIPLSVYLKNSLVKVEIGLAKGKKLYDKREDAAKRDAQREIERHLKFLDKKVTQLKHKQACY